MQLPPLHPILTLESKIPPGRGGGMVGKGRKQMTVSPSAAGSLPEAGQRWRGRKILIGWVFRVFTLDRTGFLISENDQKKSHHGICLRFHPIGSEEQFKLSVSGDEGKVVVFWLDYDNQFMQLYILTHHTHKALFAYITMSQKRQIGTTWFKDNAVL